MLALGAITGLAALGPAAEGKRQAREALLPLVGYEEPSAAASLAIELVSLDPTAEEKRQTRQKLLELLTVETSEIRVNSLVKAMAELDPAAEDKRIVCNVLLGMLTHQADGHLSVVLASHLAKLAETTDLREQVRDALLAEIARSRDTRMAAPHSRVWVRSVANLTQTAEEKRQARYALLELLAEETHSEVAEELADGIAMVDPTIHDLLAWPTTAPPTAGVLAAVRRNSTTTDWLAALPALTAILD